MDYNPHAAEMAAITHDDTCKQRYVDQRAPLVELIDLRLPTSEALLPNK